MKILMSILLSIVSTGADVPVGAGEVYFHESVVTMLQGLSEVRKPELPEPDDWDSLDSPTSAKPGRIYLPKTIIVDKPATRLYVRNAFGDLISDFRICASKIKGQKQEGDDWRTPEGEFKVIGIYNSTDWTYKDTDDKCYGPIFISLHTPRFWGIGIHGTNAPWSIPGRRSHGCIRMHNEDIVRVRRMVDKDTRVTVLPDPVTDVE